MQKLMLWVIALAAAQSLQAQDLTGAWQGTLQAGRELRTVIKISKTDTGAMKAVFRSIDQPGEGIPSSTVSLHDSVARIEIPGVGGVYEGKLSADGNSIAGTWSQGPKPLPLNPTRATPQSEWAIPEPPPRPKAMPDDADPVFEVATIKPANPNTPGRGIRVIGRQFSSFNTSVAALLNYAYGLQVHQLIGGPAWIETEKYDITAKPDGEGQPSGEQWRTMMRKLLADRFKLTFHRDKKELSVYVLSVLKTGSKLMPSDGGLRAPGGVGFNGLGKLAARNSTIAGFTTTMETTALDRPILDQTGLTGRYDFALSWVPDEFQFSDVRYPGAPPIPVNTEGTDLFTAIQQQLGLKLEATKAPAEVFVIDHVEHPSEN